MRLPSPPLDVEVVRAKAVEGRRRRLLALGGGVGGGPAGAAVNTAVCGEQRPYGRHRLGGSGLREEVDLQSEVIKAIG